MKPTALLRACACLLLLPAALLAQEDASHGTADDGLENDWFPGEYVVAPLLAYPLETRPSAALLVVDRDLDDSFEGSHLEARVGIGFQLPIVRFQEEAPGRPAIDLGFDVGVWSRFFMESLEKEQIDTDWRIAVPLGMRYRAWDFRLTLQHVSSHLGDDYLDDNPQEVFQSSREGLELLVGLRPGSSVRLYAGGDFNFGRSEDFTGSGTSDDPYVVFETIEKWAFRFGAEWDQTRWGDKRIAPFAAADLETTEFTERIALLVKAGAAFRVKALRFYIDLEYHHGPSPMGQFRTVDETWVGLNLMGEI